jgi:DNA modification methylase
MRAEIICGDCLSVMRAMESSSVDAIVCDPPYGLGFMGNAWDSFAESAQERAWNTRGRNTRCEVGGNGAGGTARSGVGLGNPNYRCANCGQWLRDRPQKKCSCGQFVALPRENRDALRFQQFMTEWASECWRVAKPGAYLLAFGGTRTYHRLACAIEDAGWEIHDTIAWVFGQGFPKHKSKLKPAFEPVVLARKPAPRATPLQIDACRIAGSTENARANKGRGMGYHGDDGERGAWTGTAGRWPANLVLSHSEECNGECAPDCPVRMLDEQSGERGSGAFRRSGARAMRNGSVYGAPGTTRHAPDNYGDTGGASRFFYVAKASRTEREAGLEGFAKRSRPDDGYGSIQQPKLDRSCPRENWTPHERANGHPCVKPIALMRWLVRLVSPPGGTVLDPFCGSGTTGIACALEGLRFVGIDQDAAYVEIARARIAHWTPKPEAQFALGMA